jgi:hypothetical protein
MAFVDRIGSTGAVSRATPRPAAGGAAFTVTARPIAAPGGPIAVAEVGLGSMLAMQEVESGAVRDREARRRGQDMLAALASLQRSLLDFGSDTGPTTGAGSGSALRQLAALAGQVPQAADPALREAVAAVTLRVRVELARHESVTG